MSKELDQLYQGISDKALGLTSTSEIVIVIVLSIAVIATAVFMYREIHKGIYGGN